MYLMITEKLFQYTFCLTIWEKGMDNTMMNIGKEMERKLISIGVDSAEKLIELGAKQAFVELKQESPNVCLVRLYTLETAIQNTEFNSLSEEKKKELKEFSDFLKR